MGSHPVDLPKLDFRPGKGIRFQSQDKQFAANLKIRGQILYTLEHADSETEDSMQIRRARLALQGHAFGIHNKYKFEIAVSPRDDFTRNGAVGTAPLLDWYLTFDYIPAATVVVGQYKIPYNRQRVISSGSLQFVDRSIVQGEFNLDRDIGLDLRASELLAGVFRYYAGFYIGEGRNAFELRPVSPQYLLRLEALPFGDFDDYSEADFERLLEPRLSVGAAYSYIDDSGRDQGVLGSAPEDDGTTDFHNLEADVIFKMAGFSFQGELFYRNGRRNPGGAVDPDTMEPIPITLPRDGWGFFTQAGYLIPRQRLELGARYGQMLPDDTSSLSEQRELGGVASYYFAHHTWKLQADYFRLWGDAGIGDGVDQVRVQMEFGL